MNTLKCRERIRPRVVRKITVKRATRTGTKKWITYMEKVMTKLIEGTVVYEDELYVEHEVDYQVTLEIDNNYGADADGNRGTKAVFVGDVDYEYPKEDMTDAAKVYLYDLVCDHAMSQE